MKKRRKLLYSLLIIGAATCGQLLYSYWGTISPQVKPLFKQLFGPLLAGDSTPAYYHQVPILCFHNLDGAGRYSTDREQFREYMEVIRKLGIEVIPLRRLYDHARRRQLLSRPATVITVDDNYKNNFRLLAPILREYRYPATFFVYTKEIQKNPIWGSSWDDLRRLYAENFDIQNHSYSHRSFYKSLPGESLAAYQRRIRAEIIGSRELLERKIPNLQIWAFAYPMGYHSDYLQRALTQAGYQLQLASNGRPVDLTTPFSGVFGRFAVQKRQNSGKDLLFKKYLLYALRSHSPQGKDSQSGVVERD